MGSRFEEGVFKDHYAQIVARNQMKKDGSSMINYHFNDVLSKNRHQPNSPVSTVSKKDWISVKFSTDNSYYYTLNSLTLISD